MSMTGPESVESFSEIRRGEASNGQGIDAQLREMPDDQLFEEVRIAKVILNHFGISHSPTSLIEAGIAYAQYFEYRTATGRIVPTPMDCFMALELRKQAEREMRAKDKASGQVEPEDTQSSTRQPWSFANFHMTIKAITNIAMVNEELLRRSDGKITHYDWPTDLHHGIWSTP